MMESTKQKTLGNYLSYLKDWLPIDPKSSWHANYVQFGMGQTETKWDAHYIGSHFMHAPHSCLVPQQECKYSFVLLTLCYQCLLQSAFHEIHIFCAHKMYFPCMHNAGVPAIFECLVILQHNSSFCQKESSSHHPKWCIVLLLPVDTLMQVLYNTSASI